MEKTHKSLYAIIAGIACVLIVLGSFFWYQSHNKSTTGTSTQSSTNSNPFGVSNSISPSSAGTPSGNALIPPSPNPNSYPDLNENREIVTQTSPAVFSGSFLNYNPPQGESASGQASPYPSEYVGSNSLTNSQKPLSRAEFRNTTTGQLAYNMDGEAGVDATYAAYLQDWNNQSGSALGRNSNNGNSGSDDSGGSSIGIAVGGAVVGALVAIGISKAISSSQSSTQAFQNFGTNTTMTINNITECTCESSRLLEMTDVRGKSLSLLVTPGTIVKSNAYTMYGIHTGQSTTGDYIPGGACLVYHGEDCSSEGNPDGMIRQMGTSI
ncbi:MAG: hypothetical protein V4481_02395 [Patescibacteria group bacterium]